MGRNPHLPGPDRLPRARNPARQPARRTILSLIAPTASAVVRGVLHHPLHQLIERDARIGSKFRHERGLGHAGLGIDLKADQLSRPPIVVAKVRAADPTAAKRVMRSQSQSSDLLVNIW